MKLHYYPETDSLYVEFQERPSVDTREIAVDVRLDLDTLETKGLPRQPAALARGSGLG